MRAQWENEKKVILDIKAIKQEIEDAKYEIEEAERQYNLEKMATLKYGTLPDLERKLAVAQDNHEKSQEHRLLKEEVNEEEIAEVVSRWTGISVAKLVETEKEKLLKLGELLHRRVVGQEEAVTALSDAILFDEIEKAHPDVFNILLQILDDGRLTDNQGRTVDFKNTILIMTSNIGSKYLIDNIKPDGSITPEVKEFVKDEMKLHFRPEFLNRIDDIVVFTPLTEREIMFIIDLAMKRISDKLIDRGITITLTEKTKKFIAEDAYSPTYGARPVNRYLQKHIETELATKIIKGEIKDGENIVIDVKNDMLSF